MGSQTITDSLREATRAIHQRLESTEYSVAMMNGAIAIESYVGYLRVLTVLHGALESALDCVSHPVLGSLWTDELRRTAVLWQDLDFFRVQLIPDTPAAIETALRTADKIRLLAVNNPVALVGVMYTLYGSSQGANVLRRSLNSNLGLSASHGARYFNRHGEEGIQDWQELAHRIDSSAIDDSEIGAITETAQQVFQCIYDAFVVLHPLDRSALYYAARTLNLESGDFSVPQDPEILRAVLRSTDRVLTDYPYILYRYGDRGRRFTDADGGWLATLPEVDEVIMSDQLDWLRNVLSSRGIPHVIVARHLWLLAEELRGTSYNQEYVLILSGTADSLYGRIDTQIPPEIREQQLSVLCESLGRSSGYSQNNTLCRETIELIASAVVDYECGVKKAVESLVGYLTDENRFGSAWTRAIPKIVETFQRRLGK